MTRRVTDDLRDSFAEVCSRYEATLDAFEVDRDHAHLLVSYPPKVALSKLVMSMKTIPALGVRQHNWSELTRALWGDHFWSPSYAVISCGGAPLEKVEEYIDNQQSPNRKSGFQKEQPRATNGVA